MTIFIREFMRNRKSFIIWTLCLVITNISMMAFFPYMGGKAEMLDELYKQFPKEMLSAFNLEDLNLGKVLSYFAYVFQYVVLFAGINAMLLGASIISKEEGEKTVEFLMAKPVTRNTIVTAKAVYALAYIIAFNLIFLATNYFVFEAVKNEEYNFRTFILLHLGMLLIQLTFAAVGLVISMFVVKAKSVFPVSLGVVLGTYFISMAAAMSEKLENLKYLTPFKYVNPADLVKNERIEGLYIVIMLVVIAISTAMTYVFYNRKNISV